MSEKLLVLQRNISKLIEGNLLSEAKSLVENYRSICQDANYYSLLSVILFLEGNKLESLKVVYEGIARFPFDTDLYYNLSTIYEDQGTVSWANIALYYSDFFNKLTNYENQSSASGDDNKNLIVIGDDKTVSYLAENFPKIFDAYNLVEYLFDGKSEVNIIVDERNIIFFDDEIIKSKIEEKLYKETIESLSVKYTDYLILKSDINLNLPVEGFKYKIRQALLKPKVSTVVLGLSYAEVGVLESELKECVNMALSSQDLFYDFEVLRLFLENNRFDVKNVVINLAYYSFMYDLSKTFERERIRRYLPFINKGHNFSKTHFLNLLSYRYKLDSEEIMYINNHKHKINQKFTEESIEKGKKYAKFHSKIGSKKIEDENIKIFSDILSLLRKHEIEPYILICPVTKYYYEHFDYDLKDRFYKVLGKTKIDISDSVIDLFDNELFNEADFWDDSHLNYEGALKLSNHVASKINL